MAKKKKTNKKATRRATHDTPAKAVAKARRSARKPAPKMSPDALMAAWRKAATPAEGHRRLEPLAGQFRTRTTFVMAPGGDPQVSEGRSENTWVVGGRYLRQVYQGSNMGMFFEGLGYTGFDNVRGRYVGTWMDSFGTGLMNSIGVGQPTDDEIAFEAESLEPTGEPRKFSCKIRIDDADHHSYEMWTRAPNGRRCCMMKVEYTRI